MKKTIQKKLVRIAVIVCIAIFLITNIYLLNEKTLRGNALPMPFGFGTAIVLSGSMEPTYYVDDMIFVTAAEEYAVGDVVVYQSGTALVVHRVIAVENGMVTTQGDANNTADEPVALEQIKGTVVGHLPNMGGMIRSIKSPVVSFGMMGFAIFLLERSFRKEKEQDSDEIQKMEEEIRRLKEQTEN
jgi:signal peptidase